ncbi:uncharacterized protein [Nicotiana tomentosiformis]|uniref:uncharacterized protein n=1 Tax=Nicotiana tomentosiformis TaxID=4098 RepID=UPI00388C5425
MANDEQRILDRFGRLRPLSFSGAEIEDAQGFLDTWWKAYERSRLVGAIPLTWHKFSVLFLEKFVPQSRKEELRRQFEQLRHDGMERIMRFIDGLAYQLRLLMSRESVSDAIFDEVVDIAWQIEVVCNQERGEREAKRPCGPGDFSGVPSRVSVLSR